MEERIEKMEKDISEIKKDISFLKEEMRLGFNTLNTTLEAMFNITSTSIRVNKEVNAIMANAHEEASEKYNEIKAIKK